MTDPTTEFFHGLRARRREPLVKAATATVRFDIAQGGRTDRWCVRIDKGDLTVSTGDTDAECVIRAERTVFDRIATGEMNALAALLRGELTLEGEPDLLVLCQRLFPGPPRKGDREPVAPEGGRSS